MDESKHRKEAGIEQDGMWMLVEFLGHHKLAGFVTEEQKWGQVLLRIDIPTGINPELLEMDFTTQWYGTHALYCATPISRSDAINLSKKLRPRPFDEFDLNREMILKKDDNRGKSLKEDDLPF